MSAEADPGARGRFTKASVRDADVSGRTVLVRADLNAPLEGGEVSDDKRIRAALPTIELLRDRGAKIVLCSHLGRPQGRDPELSLAPVARRLGELLGAEVELAPAVVGPEVAAAAAELGAGSVLLLENTRFEPGEQRNDPGLADDLAELADLYVNDAFGAAHRAHASTEGVAHRLPAYSGLLLEREVRELTAVLDDPARPLVVVLGGAKVTDKVGVIERFLELADEILIGGAMCFSFFRAQGHETGNSLVDEDGIGAAKRALERAAASSCELRLPTDLVLGESFSADARPVALDGVDVPDGMMGLDVGPATSRAYADAIAAAGHRLLERADGGLRARAVRGRHPRGRRGRRRQPGDDDRRRRRLRCRARPVRPRGRGQLAVDRRRCGAGADRGQGAARGRGADRRGCGQDGRCRRRGCLRWPPGGR